MSTSAVDLEQPTKAELRDRRRGYSINTKFVCIAYAGEITLIVVSMVGACLFADMYSHGNRSVWWMMLLAPISYGVVEFCRVPLAIAARTQKSFLIRALAGLGVLCAAGVTVKSLSQLGEQMFHPRLIDVVQAKETLDARTRARETVAGQIRDAEAVVDQRSAELKALDDHRANLTAQMATVSKPTCAQVHGRNKKGGTWSNLKCVPDPKGEVISANLRLAGADHGEAAKRLDLARAERTKLDIAPLDKAVSEAKTTYRTAVLHSQLHSFTAMAFGKDPSEVTDGEVHAFLRVFVFFPAIFASLASTLLALASVNTVKTPAEIAEEADAKAALSLPEVGGAYALGGLAEHVIRETTRRVHEDAQQRVSAAAAAIGPPSSSVALVKPAA